MYGKLWALSSLLSFLFLLRLRPVSWENDDDSSVFNHTQHQHSDHQTAADNTVYMSRLGFIKKIVIFKRASGKLIKKSFNSSHNLKLNYHNNSYWYSNSFFLFTFPFRRGGPFSSLFQRWFLKISLALAR